MVISNWGYLFDEDYTEKPLSPDKVEMAFWEKGEDGVYTSLVDPQIILTSIGRYINYIEIDCDISGGSLTPKIYYTSGISTQFIEESAFIPDFEYNEGKLILYMDKQVQDIRLDLSEESGIVFALGDIKIYVEASLRFDPLYAMMWVFLVVLLMSPMYLPKNFTKGLRDIFVSFSRYKYLLTNLIHRDIVTKYRRSVLGIIWSILNPLLMMLIITAVFQNIFKVNIDNFSLYYLTGWLIFNYVAEATTTAMNSILESSTLIRKVYVPKYIFPLEKCLSSFVNMFFSLIAVCVMFVFLQFAPSWTFALVFIPMIYVLVFSAGLGMILATANVFFRDVQYLYSVWTTAWMYLTPIIYPLESLPDKIVSVIKLNPLYYYVDYFRELVLYGNVPGLEHNLICIFYSLAFLLVGSIIFKRNQDKFILHI